jgi:hypothetical protein
VCREGRPKFLSLSLHSLGCFIVFYFCSVHTLLREASKPCAVSNILSSPRSRLTQMQPENSKSKT